MGLGAARFLRCAQDGATERRFHFVRVVHFSQNDSWCLCIWVICGTIAVEATYSAAAAAVDVGVLALAALDAVGAVGL